MNILGRLFLVVIIFDVGAIVACVVRDGSASVELLIGFGFTALAFIFFGGKKNE